MMSRIVILGCTGIAAVIALAVAGVDWIDTGTAPQSTKAAAQLQLHTRVIAAEAAVDRPRIEGPSGRDLLPPGGVLSPIRTDETHKVAMQTVGSLAEVPGQHAESALAGAALSNAHPAVREEAVHALGERGGAIALQTLQQVLQDPSPRVRQAAVQAFVDIGGDEAMLILSSALGSDDASLRVSALDALALIGGPAARPYIEQMLGDENDGARAAAGEWLAEFEADPSAQGVREGFSGE
jgi:HEAT repeat protein